LTAPSLSSGTRGMTTLLWPCAVLHWTAAGCVRRDAYEQRVGPMSMRISDSKIGCGRTILPLRDGRYRTWPLPDLGRLASPATRPPQAAAWEPARRHGDWRTPRGRLTGASEQNAPVPIEAKTPPDCTHAVRLPAERTNERPANNCSRSRDATAPRDDARYCQRVSDTCAFDLDVSTRSQELAAI